MGGVRVRDREVDRGRYDVLGDGDRESNVEGGGEEG